MIEFLARNESLFVLIHMIAVALGVGGATISDVLFFRYLKDRKISPKEEETLLILSNVIWFAILLFLISGFALFLPNREELIQSSKFLVKMTVVAVIILNGFFLNMVVSPRLKKITEKAGFRRVAFASGAISIVSWYTALVLGLTESIPMAFWPLLSVYLDVVIVAVALSQVAERLRFKG